MSFNNGPRTVVTGLSLLVDAADPLSYPGSGTSWTDIVTGITGSLSGSITYASDFKGTLVVNNSSSVIIFPTSSGNFGTDSFTVELAFQPNQINGQHWLVAKNSGSFPSWGAFITGSSGSGRITAFFNVSSTISCSMSTPVGSIVTGSNYLVDINFFPSITLNSIYLNSELSGSNIPNGGGSLTATSSLFISNRNSGSSVGTPLEIFNTKLYTPRLVPGMIRQNYNSLSTRLGLSQKLSLPIIEEGLLNLYPGAAAAYSLRSLNSDYGGAAIQVRRSSDNAVANIGFTSNGDLDTIALLAHCGSGNGFVTEWFDQSGNGINATQATALNQPQIVNNGSILNLNSKPTVQFTKSRNDNLRNIAFSISGATTFTWVGSITTPINNWSYVFGIGTYSGTAGYQYTPNTFLTVNDWQANDLALVGNGFSSGRAPRFVSNGPQYTSGVQALTLGILSTTTSAVYKNNSLVGQRIGLTGNVGTNVGIYIGTNNFNEALPGNIQELIFWNSDQNPNVSGINTNTNEFYSIY